MRITKIENQKKRPSRKSVFIDGAFAFGVSDEVLLRHSLRQGDEVNQETVDRIVHSEDEEEAKQKAFRFLGIRPRSKKEIRDYLSKKSFAGDVVEHTVAKLESLKMLDDLEFSRMVCRDMLLRKPAGEKMLRQQLFKKGVPKELADTVVAEFSTPEAELMMAVQAAERQSAKFERSSKKLDGALLKKKILDYLMRRGFDFDTAMNATKHLRLR
ncbi:MAG TPA: RecX family transcriptional regulator [Bacteroidota bacterium]|nr:RecX family transcriptional regulator [Bacteroidota bacterium]